jgi:hypothetical protein
MQWLSHGDRVADASGCFNHFHGRPRVGLRMR